MNVKNSAELKKSTVKELSVLARQLGVSGWHDMRKDELVAAIVAKNAAAARRKAKLKSENAARKTSKKSVEPEKKKTVISRPKKAPAPAAVKGKAEKTAPHAKERSEKRVSKPKSPSPEKSKKQEHPAKPEIPAKREPATNRPLLTGNLSGIYEETGGENRDRFVLLVRDPYWLHVYWELCVRLIERAKAAMGHSWHTAVPVLRLFRIVADGMNNPRRDLIRDIRVHDGANNWYIDVQDPPGTFQVEIGFLSREKNFFPVASSNIVQTPQNQVVSGTAKLDGHWGSVSEDFDRIYKLSGGMEGNNKQLKTVFEEQLHRSMSLPLISRFGARSGNYEKTKRHFEFVVDADLVIYGKTDPSVQISIKGEPIRVANDGSFSVRYSIAEKRQVFPIDAKGSDGIETQQVILAIERNTKVLETIFLDSDEDD